MSEGTRAITIRLEATTYKRAKVVAAQRGLSLIEWIPLCVSAVSLAAEVTALRKEIAERGNALRSVIDEKPVPTAAPSEEN